ncbi:MAG: Ig-like domain-containing protein, partial [Gemmatimonadaceae bacterium]|nr:Ig-like domain-containing protein [Gemmatimonadaceae bacterium]
MIKSLRPLFTAAAAILALVACSNDESDPSQSVGPNPEQRLTLILSADTDSVPEATSKPLTARVTDQTGLLKSVPISWRSTDPTIVSVSEGMVTGVATGSAFVIASSGSLADSARIIVTPNDLTLDVQPSAAAVAQGDTVTFVATLRSRSGDIISVNHYAWTSSDTAAAEFIDLGALKTKREGDISVSAETLNRRGWSRVKIFRSPVASVTITPNTANVYKGERLELDVTLRDQGGRLVEGDVSWGSTDFTKATVTQDGVVRGLSVGTVVITATSGAKTGSATINVLDAPAASVVLSAPTDTVLVGLDVQVSATPLDAGGNPISGRTIAYQSSNASIATVTSSGVVKGLADGSANISAIVDGLIATRKMNVRSRRATRIAVSPTAPSVTVGRQSQLVARVYDQIDVEMNSQPVAWSSSNPAVMSVSSTGLLTAQAAGSATIRATSGSLASSVEASAVSAPVASVQVSPATLSLQAGGQTALTASAFDESGNLLSGRVASWSSQNPTVATVSSSGVVSAIAAGTTGIVANIEGRTATATISVNVPPPPPPAPVASVTVLLGSSVLNVDGTTQATAVLRDAQGNQLTGRSITWMSLDTTVARVSSSGLVTARAGGTVAIMARSENVSGSASLTVNTPAPAPVAWIDLLSPTFNLMVGQQVQTTVVLEDANDNVLTGRTVLYATSNPAILSVSATGVITAISAGSAQVTASSGSASISRTFTVTAPAPTPVLTTITVSPATAALTVGQTQQGSAVAKDQFGATMNGTTFTWTTSNAAVATVSGSGLVTATGAGTATIRAAASGVTGSLSVTVTQPAQTPATVASVTVTLSSSSILVAGTTQATAVARDAQGNTITGRPVTWSGGGSLASVSGAGLVTGLAAGTATVTATIDGKSGSATLTISAPLPPPSSSSLAELPRVLLNFPYPAKTGQTIVVSSGGDLQAALNTAQRGDEIVLAAGATFTGNFVL